MIALVTGASSGIGRDIAEELAKRHYNIIATARNEEALNELKDRLEEKYNIFVDVIIQDLTDREGVIKLHDTVFKKYGAIDILINNAGFGDCNYFIDGDLNKELNMIDTNITALHILTKLFLKDMVKKNHGRIMNVASIAGFMPGPLMATYYSTKAYVVRFTQALRTELFLKHSKVKICCLCPGPVNTNFNKNANVRFNLIGANSKLVAKHAVNMMLLNRILIYSGIGVMIARIAAKILPDQLMALICSGMQRRKLGKNKITKK